ncbi:gephyrin-like molybdotransferase receptor GlpR [Streptomyces canus]|uniref:divisome protein SepX/GlpR n=1 Tax=Streptomyces canus TaxID=58343 RepID=UPI00225AC9F8|nr:gephyrin-like molybdotransferase receptor GlpR [Streptomyces canus]
MSSSGLIYAVIVGAWAAYLVPMWLRRQDELNEARPTERFSTAIRLLSGRAGMERRYAKDLRARSTDEGEHGADEPDAVTESVDVRAFAMPPTRPQAQATVQPSASERREAPREPEHGGAPTRKQAPAPAASAQPQAQTHAPAPRRTAAAEAAAARARRTKALARRRRTTVMLFLAFTLGTIVAAVGGLAFLWAPGVPAVMLSAYIAHLRSQERRRFAYQMDRRRAEAAAQRLRERARQPRRRSSVSTGVEADEPEEGPATETDTGLSALAADRRALVEQTDHAEWIDQQRERQHRPGHGDSWDPVPVPLPTYVTAPVAPRATSDVDLGAPDAWSSARSSSAATPEQAGQEATPVAEDEASDELPDDAEDKPVAGDRSDARRAASARRARERGRTPLFDQYEEGDRPRAANE